MSDWVFLSIMAAFALTGGAIAWYSEKRYYQRQREKKAVEQMKRYAYRYNMAGDE